ncbi:MAG TPA: hypothetical protein PKJ99_02425 [Thermoanaerobaculales bacterium]|nr:hypothetical protein [Thermoanaerobaculales bacterium]
MSALDTIRRLIASGAEGLNSLVRVTSCPRPSPEPTSEPSPEEPDSTNLNEETKKAPGDWTEVSIPPPPVTLAELEADLRHWPGVPRCAVAELERAGVPREEAMVRVREQYQEQGEEADE